MKVLITGAAGNLGSLLARHLCNRSDLRLRLMVHQKALPNDLARHGNVETVVADLGKPETLRDAVSGVDQIIHFAGVLFRANPEKFLPITNTLYFKNLVDSAVTMGVKKVVLVSFPHVEGPTSPKNPAQGRLDQTPVSHHARTRLEEERYLFEKVNAPVSMRVGMVYGQGILMIDAAKWLAKRHLLGVWRVPTHIQLISRDDFCGAFEAVIRKPEARGIYHVGDEGLITLQEFLDLACLRWGCGTPWRLPLSLIHLAALGCEVFAGAFKTQSPLTRDFIRIGRVSYHGDTARFRQELLPVLKYRTIHEGIDTL